MSQKKQEDGILNCLLQSHLNEKGVPRDVPMTRTFAPSAEKVVICVISLNTSAPISFPESLLPLSSSGTGNKVLVATADDARDHWTLQMAHRFAASSSMTEIKQVKETARYASHFQTWELLTARPQFRLSFLRRFARAQDTQLFLNFNVVAHFI